MSDEPMSVEVGRVGEVPTCPDNVQRGLREFDPRLRCVFNARHNVWEIQERLKTSGVWSHVLYWHDGHWRNKEYRPLPFTAEPLILAIQKIDLLNKGIGLGELERKLEAEGAHNRARAMVSNRFNRAKKLEAYMRWLRERRHVLASRFARGGQAAADASREREDVLNDLGLRRKE